MLESIWNNPNRDLYIYGSIAVICAVIVLMGFIKNSLANKIQNKLLRKIVLAFTSVFMVFPATLLSCWANDLSLDYYWKMLAINVIGTILTYWLYENTGLRDLINIVGKTTILKLILAFSSKNGNKDVKKAQDIAKKTTMELNKEAQKALKSTIDETLKHL